MRSKGSRTDANRILARLKAFAEQNNVSKLTRIHAELLQKGLLFADERIGSSLVHLYAKCGALTKARGVFDYLQNRNVISWTAMIDGYAQHGFAEKALSIFQKMQCNDILPNEVTFVCLLKACGSLRNFQKGKEIQALVSNLGFIESNAIVGTALVDMYAKSGALQMAQDIFDQLSDKDTFLWTVLIAGYVQHGYDEKALSYFAMMQCSGASPNTATFVQILKACGNIRTTEMGEEIHAEIARRELVGKNNLVHTALTDMYVKCTAVRKAHEVFNQVSDNDIVSWNVLIAGYVQKELDGEALSCFEQMKQEGLSPDSFTLVCALKACGNMGAFAKGEQIHVEVLQESLLKKNIIVGTTLIDMYARCGSIVKIEEVFDDIPAQNVVSWNALMRGYAHLGKDDRACYVFEKMIGQGIQPNMFTLTVVLNACSHSGLLDKGQTYFENMTASFGIVPNLQHQTCIVDLFGRAGHFHQVMAMVKRMPAFDHLPMWSALLGACQKWGKLELGRWAFEHVTQLDTRDTGPYVCMANIHAASLKHDSKCKI